jgi:hypothetical protein
VLGRIGGEASGPAMARTCLCCPAFPPRAASRLGSNEYVEGEFLVHCDSAFAHLDHI